MSLSIQIPRMRIPYFAKWARLNTPFTKEKHYLKNNKICFDVKQGEEYANHIETAGFYCASIISYGADSNGNLRLMRHTTFPTLRLYPNLTGSSLDRNFNGYSVVVDGHTVNEKATKFVFDGILHIYSKAGNVEIHRSIFSARECKACIERVELINKSDKTVSFNLKCNDKEHITKAYHGVDRRRYRFFTQCSTSTDMYVEPHSSDAIFAGYCACDYNESFTVDFEKELSLREAFVDEISKITVIKTPDEKINTMAFYTKIRACESIFKTKAGLMHSPGGGYYYAAIWTNDECEYVNPLYAYLGYETGREQALNTYDMYQKYISSDKALITSIIAEGDGIWHGVNDRGDSAMYAYGCSRYLLTNGSKQTAEKYINSIRKCIDYTISQIGENGVVRSDSDELENRFESGTYNLCTSSLTYDALISVSYLEREFGNNERADELLAIAKDLRKAIEKYFGKNVEGFDTYMYCEEEKNLRAWIAIPLAMGIDDRSNETVSALLSDKLFKNGGIVTRSGEKTYWDRATLYALRGMFCSGHQNEAVKLLKTFTSARLLGEHIPYPVEAFPEGNQAQLSAESGLYLRIFTEGILGYRPTGFNSFTLKPNLPDEWNEMSVENIMLCGKSADIFVSRKDNGYEIKVDFDDKSLTEFTALDNKIEFVI